MQVVVCDVRGDRLLGVIEINVRAEPNFFTFQGSDETFTDRIVGRRSRSAKALQCTIFEQQVLVARSVVSAAAIRVMHERSFRSARNQRHSQCLDRQVGGDVRSDRPTNTAATECVDDHREVCPTGSQRHERDVGQPQVIRSAWNEPRQVWKIFIRSASAAPFRASQWLCEQIVHAHQLHHVLGIHRFPLAKAIGHLPIAVARMLDQHFLDRNDEPRFSLARLRSKRAVQRRSRQVERARKRCASEAHHTIWRRNDRAGKLRGQREDRYSVLSRATSLMRRKTFFRIRFSAASWPNWRSSSPIFALSV